MELGSKFSWAALCLNGAGVLVVLGSFMFQWSWGQNCPGQLYVTAGLLGGGGGGGAQLLLVDHFFSALTSKHNSFLCY